MSASPAMTPELLEAMRQVSAQLQAGQFRQAHDRLELIVAALPGFVEALRLLAGAKLALGDAQLAERLLRRALELDANWPPTLTTLGELLLAAGRSTEATPFLERAAAGTPPDPRAALVLARLYNDTRRPADAVRVAAAHCSGDKLDPELAAQHIAALATLGRQTEALTGYRRLAERLPRSATTAHALALALATADQHAEAVRVVQTLLASGYQHPSLHRLHGRSLNALGAPDEAESALQQCVRLEPRQVNAHQELAQLIWLRTGSVAAATGPLDRALTSFPQDALLLAAKAAILQGAGDARAAFDCLAPLTKRVDAPPALLLRAGLAAIEFNAPAALELAKRAVGCSPGDAAARSLLVAAQLGVGDARVALAHCESLLAESPNDQYLIALQTTAWRLLGDERYAAVCDYEELVAPFQLETPPGWANRADFLADLATSLGRLHNPRGHPLLFQSLRGGTETALDLSRSSDPVIQALFQTFRAPIDAYLARIGRGVDPLRRRNTGRWRFNGSWSVRLLSSGYHTIHTHPRGWISSACYIELPEEMTDSETPEGTLRFGQPGFATTPALGHAHVVQPAVGMLVLFPSYFWHGTVPFTGSRARLTVAFDIVPAT